MGQRCTGHHHHHDRPYRLVLPGAAYRTHQRTAALHGCPTVRADASMRTGMMYGRTRRGCGTGLQGRPGLSPWADDLHLPQSFRGFR